MNRIKRTIGLAILSSVATGVGVLGNYIMKTSKEILYRVDHDAKEPLEYEEIVIKNEQGVKLHAYLISSEDVKQTVMVLHPFKKDAVDMVPYVTYLKQKIGEANFLLIDARSHGLSDGYMRGLGDKDVDDLVCWNQYLINQYGDDHKIVIYGKEMGGATAIIASGKHVLKNVSMIISDSTYTSFYSILKSKILKDRFPVHPTIELIRNKVKLDSGIDIKTDIVHYAKHNDIPTIFIHAKNDPIVPIKQVYPLYNASRGSKELFVLKDEKELYEMQESEEFRQTLDRFIQKYS